MELMTKRELTYLIVYMPRFSHNLLFAKYTSKCFIVLNTRIFVTLVVCHVAEFLVQLANRDCHLDPNIHLLC